MQFFTDILSEHLYGHESLYTHKSILRFFYIVGTIFFIIGVYDRREVLSLKRQIKVEIVRALGNIGKNSDETAITLQEMLSHRNKNVRKEAALALGKIGSCANIAIPNLINALKDRHADVRWRATETLGLIGINTDNIVSNLNNLVHDKCDYVCEAAIQALDSISEKE